MSSVSSLQPNLWTSENFVFFLGFSTIYCDEIGILFEDLDKNPAVIIKILDGHELEFNRWKATLVQGQSFTLLSEIISKINSALINKQAILVQMTGMERVETKGVEETRSSSLNSMVFSHSWKYIIEINLAVTTLTAREALKNCNNYSFSSLPSTDIALGKFDLEWKRKIHPPTRPDNFITLTVPYTIKYNQPSIGNQIQNVSLENEAKTNNTAASTSYIPQKNLWCTNSFLSNHQGDWNAQPARTLYTELDKDPTRLIDMLEGEKVTFNIPNEYNHVLEASRKDSVKMQELMKRIDTALKAEKNVIYTSKTTMGSIGGCHFFNVTFVAAKESMSAIAEKFLSDEGWKKFVSDCEQLGEVDVTWSTTQTGIR